MDAQLCCLARLYASTGGLPVWAVAEMLPVMNVKHSPSSSTAAVSFLSIGVAMAVGRWQRMTVLLLLS